MKKFWLAGFALGLLLTSPAKATDETLPTPYTAEQIRDAYVKGLKIVTRYTSAKGVKSSLSEVVEWSAEGMTISDQPLDDSGTPEGDAQSAQATWEELRDHAKFPAEQAQRERTRRKTPLGDAEGWLYVLTGKGGVTSEFFFADAWPGAPVVYSQIHDGEVRFKAEMIERSVPEK